MELLLKLVHQQRFIGRTVVNGLSTTVPCRSAADNVFLTDKKSDALFPNFSFLINRCCFKVNLFICLDNIFSSSLINRLIKLMFL
jgi:hypothetical protein